MWVKLGIASVLSLLVLPLLAVADCTALKGCERKFCEIEQQLAYARAQNHKKQVAGLSRSLEQAKKHCTEQQLREDLQKEIADTKADIADYEKDATEAAAAGKMKKVAKYQRKIEQARVELLRLEAAKANLD